MTPTPDPQFIIRQLDGLKALSHPLRLNILRRLKTAQTVKQLAERMELPPTKLYYHVNLLEEQEIIRVVDTQLVSGIVEKTYQAAALAYKIDDQLLSNPDVSSSTLEKMITAVLDNTRQELHRSGTAGLLHRKAAAHSGLLQSRLALTADQAASFKQELTSLVKKYELASPDEELAETAVFSLITLFFPIVDDEA